MFGFTSLTLPFFVSWAVSALLQSKRKKPGGGGTTAGIVFFIGGVVAIFHSEASSGGPGSNGAHFLIPFLIPIATFWGCLVHVINRELFRQGEAMRFLAFCTVVYLGLLAAIPWLNAKHSAGVAAREERRMTNPCEGAAASKSSCIMAEAIEKNSIEPCARIADLGDRVTCLMYLRKGIPGPTVCRHAHEILNAPDFRMVDQANHRGEAHRRFEVANCFEATADKEGLAAYCRAVAARPDYPGLVGARCYLREEHAGHPAIKAAARWYVEEGAYNLGLQEREWAPPKEELAPYAQ